MVLGGLGTGASPAPGPAARADAAALLTQQEAAAAMAGAELAAPEHRVCQVPRLCPGRAGSEGSESGEILSKGFGE